MDKEKLAKVFKVMDKEGIMKAFFEMLEGGPVYCAGSCFSCPAYKGYACKPYRYKHLLQRLRIK